MSTVEGLTEVERAGGSCDVLFIKLEKDLDLVVARPNGA